MRILVTGATGALGRHVVPALKGRGHSVRVMSTRKPPVPAGSDREWVCADLATGRGVAAAVEGQQTILHLASDPRHAQKVDVEGTRRLVEAAVRSGVAHIIYVSIVGAGEVPVAYYKAKLRAEEIIASSPAPHSIQRVTQFHSFVDSLLAKAAAFPLILPLPTTFRFQTVDEAEVAEHLTTCVIRGPRGRLPDVGGPEVLPLGEMARIWLAGRAMHKRIVHVPLPGAAAAAVRAGALTAPNHACGAVRWSEWLERRRYARAAC